MQRRVGNEACHDCGIDGWNDHIVLACQDQGRLANLVQPGKACPAQPAVARSIPGDVML
jgi:hypothetical protein